MSALLSLSFFFSWPQLSATRFVTVGAAYTSTSGSGTPAATNAIIAKRRLLYIHVCSTCIHTWQPSSQTKKKTRLEWIRIHFFFFALHKYNISGGICYTIGKGRECTLTWTCTDHPNTEHFATLKTAETLLVLTVSPKTFNNEGSVSQATPKLRKISFKSLELMTSLPVFQKGNPYEFGPKSLLFKMAV